MSSGVLTRRAEACVLVAGTAVALAIAMLGQLRSGTPIVPVVALCVGATVLWIVWQDLKLFTISDLAVLTFAALAFAYRWDNAHVLGDPAYDTIMSIALDAFVPGAVLLLFREVYYRRKGYDGLGLGDVKLAAAGGILVGLLGFSYALLGASLLALVFVAARRAFGARGAALDKLAFGAFLAPALWAVWMLEQTPAFAAFVET